MSCPPRYATRRRPERETFGPRLAEIAKLLGQPLMEWQRLVADVACEMDWIDVVDPETGKSKPLLVPAYREVIVTVPRQNGKTTLVLSWELDRALMWAKRQRVVYTAQTGTDARKKLLKDQVPIIQDSPFAETLDPDAEKGVRRVNGDEGLNFKNGSRLDLLASGKSAGHGGTTDLAVVDEAFDDTDDRREQAMIPSMATRADAQLIVCSTQGTDTSTYLNRKIDTGRDFAIRDADRGTAYFEWSAPLDAPIDSPATWKACMPAYGITILEPTVLQAFTSMPEGEFRRAFLNQRTASEERVIPIDEWNAVNGDYTADGRLTFAIDCNPERTSATLACADPSGRCEILEHERGTGWLVDLTVMKARKWNATVCYDPTGPAGVFGDEIERQGVRVEKVAGQDMAMACAFFFDGVIDRKIKIRTHESLNAAAAAAQKRTSADAWVWARKNDTDISPLVAVSECSWVAQREIDPVANVH